jgi:hypothetical protein
VAAAAGNYEIQRVDHGLARQAYLIQIMRYRETSPTRHRPFRGAPKALVPAGAFVIY